MTHRAVRVAAAMILAVAPGFAGAADPASPLGVWQTEGRDAHIELHPCAGGGGVLICGRIVWLKTPNKPNGEPERDDNNPNPALRARPMLGLPLIAGLAPAPGRPGRWEGGTVYNPEDGRTYGAEIALLPDGRLRMRGYLGLPLLGGSQTWIRVR